MPRVLEPELMDQPGLSPALHQRALDGLARINRLSRSADTIWKSVRQIVSTNPHRTWRVLDVASGGGDIPTAIAGRARANRLPITVHGIDVSPFAVEYAQKRARRLGHTDVQFTRHDALTSPLPDDYDIITCSLFLHHLDDTTAEAFLRKIALAARHAVLINDLRRTRVGHALAWFSCRILTRSRIVRVDGPMSSRAAYTVDEVKQMAARSGLNGAHISRRWPQRFLLRWNKPPTTQLDCEEGK
jgi:2-polyprenyl-3-methyl-5-hydroxy-6-metoxy-1,4-benzoquinol methylase